MRRRGVGGCISVELKVVENGYKLCIPLSYRDGAFLDGVSLLSQRLPQRTWLTLMGTVTAELHGEL